MVSRVRVHLARHIRFYCAASLGVIVWATTTGDVQLRLALAADTFYGTYLLLVILLIVGLTPDRLRKLADVEDEGIGLIVSIALAAICASLASLFMLLNQQHKPDMTQLVLALASAPLGWFMLHTIAALNYAQVYYGNSDLGGPDQDVGGLKFPGTDEPHIWDFIYYSFTVGMTAQVSDVMVVTTRMRLMTLAQAVIAFFFNTVLLALAVNVAVTLAQ